MYGGVGGGGMWKNFKVSQAGSGAVVAHKLLLRHMKTLFHKNSFSATCRCTQMIQQCVE